MSSHVIAAGDGDAVGDAVGVALGGCSGAADAVAGGVAVGVGSASDDCGEKKLTTSTSIATTAAADPAISHKRLVDTF